jgi:hypothetical protein
VRKAEKLTNLMCRLSRNPGALTSCTPQGHVGLFRGYFTFFTHSGISSVGVKCLVLVKMFGDDPRKLIIKIISCSEVRIDECPLFSFPFLRIVFIP